MGTESAREGTESAREGTESARASNTFEKGEPRNSARVTPSRKGALSNSARVAALHIILFDVRIS